MDKKLDRQVFLCAPTHVAARNLSVDDNQGITLQRFYNRYLKHGSVPKGGVVVIDEISQVGTQMWHRLVPLANYAQIIAMGNPEDQLGSVCDSFMDVPFENMDISESQLLRSMCGYTRLRLTVGRRSCRELFDLYASFSTIGSQFHLSLQEMIDRVPKKNKYGDINLVISHACRKKIISAVIQQRLKEQQPKNILTIPKGSDHNSQEILLWEGQVVTAVLDSVSKHGIYNAQLLRVVQWDEENLELICTESGDNYVVPLSWCPNNLRHSAAICYAAVQGRSCTNQVALWDTNNKRFTRKHLVMGLSRASKLEDVWICSSL